MRMAGQLYGVECMIGGWMKPRERNLSDLYKSIVNTFVSDTLSSCQASQGKNLSHSTFDARGDSFGCESKAL